MTARTMTAWTTNVIRQVVVLVMTPPMSGPAAAPIPAAALIAPKDRARDSVVAKKIVAKM